MSSLRESRREKLRAQIAQHALQLFAHEGFDAVTAERLAAELGISRRTFFGHFASKEDLYLAMMLGDFEDKRRLFEQAVAKPGTCRDRLTQLTRDYLELPHEERELTHLVRRDVNTFSGKERDSLISAYQKALPAQIETNHF